MGNWEGTLKSRKVKTFENYWTVSHWPPPTLIFAFSLYKKLALKNPHKNIVFSPLGIATALASLSLGAKGKTLEEILERLKSNVTETTEADIHHSFEHLLQRRSHPGDQEQIGTGNALFADRRHSTSYQDFPATMHCPCTVSQTHFLLLLFLSVCFTTATESNTIGKCPPTHLCPQHLFFILRQELVKLIRLALHSLCSSLWAGFELPILLP